MDTVARDTRSAEAAAIQIDTFIERRLNARMKDEGERAELQAWQLSARVHEAKVRRENVAAWIDYHRAAADRARRTLEALIARHEAAAQMLEVDTREGDAA